MKTVGTAVLSAVVGTVVLFEWSRQAATTEPVAPPPAVEHWESHGPAEVACGRPAFVVQLEKALLQAGGDPRQRTVLHMALARAELGRGAYDAVLVRLQDARQTVDSSNFVERFALDILTAETQYKAGRILEAHETLSSLVERQVDASQSDDAVAEGPLSWATVCHLLGNVQRDMGHFDSALQHYDESERHLALFGDEAGLAGLETDRAEAYRRQGQNKEARERLENAARVMDLSSALRQMPVPEAARIHYMQTLALTHLDAGEVDQCLALLEKCLKVQKAHQCDAQPNPETALTLVLMADAQFWKGDTSTAREALEAATSTMNKALGHNSDTVGQIWSIRADVAEAEGDWESAIDMASLARKYLTQSAGSSSLSTVIPLLTLARIASSQSNWEGAEAHLLHARAIVESTMGLRSPTGAAVSSSLAEAAEQQGNFPAALEHFKFCVEANLAMQNSVPASIVGAVADSYVTKAAEMLSSGEQEPALAMLRQTCGKWQSR